MPEAHALLSASGAHRWLACTPCVRLEEMFEAKTSEYAEEGTAAHALAELVTSYWVDQITEEEYENRLVEFKKRNKWYTEDMLEDCTTYAKLIRDKWNALKEKTGDAVVLLEAQIKYDKWAPGGFGTADCLILADKYLEVVDFKYGKGKRVDAFENPQMRMYTLGAYSTYGLVYDVENITMTIFQPRISNGLSSDEITIDDILTWGNDYVKPRALLAFEGKGDFAPSSETCKFCRAKAMCRARAEANLKLFDDAPDVMLMTIEEAGELLEKADDITSWLDDLKAYVQSSLLEGTTVPGWKLVEGRSNRRYSDPEAVASAMLAAGYPEADLYKPKELIPLTQMEKAFGKKNVAEVIGALIIKPAGKPTIAPESDKRPEYKPEDHILKAFDEGE